MRQVHFFHKLLPSTDLTDLLIDHILSTINDPRPFHWAPFGGVIEYGSNPVRSFSCQLIQLSYHETEIQTVGRIHEEIASCATAVRFLVNNFRLTNIS